MSTTAAEYFGLFLTALRNGGDLDELSDAATARLIAGALGYKDGHYASEAEGFAAESMALALCDMCRAGELDITNGSN